MKIKYLVQNSKAVLILLFLLSSCDKEPIPADEPKDESPTKVYAGSTIGYKDGPALQAKFDGPVLITKGPDNTLYVVEQPGFSQFGPINGTRIRKISPSGLVSTFFKVENSNGEVKGIRGIAVDKSGFVFVSDGDQIKRISSNGDNVTLIAGDGTHALMKDGPALSATFYEPHGLAFSKDGCLYIADTKNNAVRTLTNGKVKTLAGGDRNFRLRGVDDVTAVLPKDGMGVEAQFNYPEFITVDHNNNVFVSEGQLTLLRKISPKGFVSTLIGTGQFDWDEVHHDYKGVTISDDGRLFVNNNYNRTHRWMYNFYVGEFLFEKSEIKKLAENDYYTVETDFDLPSRTLDGLNYPTGMVVADQMLYICNSREGAIRKISIAK